MQKLLIPVSILLFIIAACKNESGPNNGNGTASVSTDTLSNNAKNDTPYMRLEVQEFENRVIGHKNIPIIDIRPEESYKAGHIFRSINWPYDTTTFFNRFESLDKRAPIALYCQSGYFSNQAGMKLVGKGYRKVYVIKGGLLQWVSDGKVLSLE